MTKELIRNGGFERGNLDFWTYSNGTAEIVNDVKKRGNYSAKLITGAAGFMHFELKDYVDISVYELYRLALWLKSVSWSSVSGAIYFYDSDYNHISGGDLTLLSKSGSFDWTKFEVFFAVPVEASYMNFWLEPYGSEGHYGYIDSISMQGVDPSKLGVYAKQLLNIGYLPVPGTYYSDEVFSGLWKYGEFFLNVTSISGSDPKIDISVQAYDPTTGVWKDIVVYDQVTSTGSQFKVVTAGLGWKVRVKYTIHSGTSDADFKVGVIFKR